MSSQSRHGKMQRFQNETSQCAIETKSTTTLVLFTMSSFFKSCIKVSDIKLRGVTLGERFLKHNTHAFVFVCTNKTKEFCTWFYFKIIYLHIIGMKTGWYICDGTGQFPYRNIQSIQKPLFQTWTKWINILVNKYISDMSLYWNVLLYIKYNTISFLFCLFFVLVLYTKYPKYTDISLKVLEGFFVLIEKAVSAHYSRKT